MQLVFLNDGGQSNVDLKYSTSCGWPAYQLSVKGTSFDSGDIRYIIGLKKNRIHEMGQYDELDREMKWLVINSREAYKAYEKARDDEVLRRVGSLPLEKK